MRHTVLYSDALEFEKTAGQNHLDTLKLAIDQANSGFNLHISTILQWHLQLLEYGGAIRNCNVIIQNSPVRPPAPYLVSIQLQALLNKVNDVEFASMLDIAKWHEEFTGIYPFTDGNGRVGRILLNYWTVKFGHGIVCLPPSERTNYLDYLQNMNIGELAKLFEKYTYQL